MNELTELNLMSLYHLHQQSMNDYSTSMNDTNSEATKRSLTQPYLFKMRQTQIMRLCASMSQNIECMSV